MWPQAWPGLGHFAEGGVWGPALVGAPAGCTGPRRAPPASRLTRTWPGQAGASHLLRDDLLGAPILCPGEGRPGEGPVVQDAGILRAQGARLKGLSPSTLE